MTKKTPTQLQREIEVSLAHPLPRRHHATQREDWEPFALPEWEVIKDALLEHNPKKAALVWQRLREEQGSPTRPESFRRALREVPTDVRQRFEDLTARTAERYVEAINDAIYKSKDPDALIAAVAAAQKHVAAMKGAADSSGAFDPAMQELGNLLVKAKEMVRRIKIERKTGHFPKPSRRTAWKLR